MFLEQYIHHIFLIVHLFLHLRLFLQIFLCIFAVERAHYAITQEFLSAENCIINIIHELKDPKEI